MVDVILTILSTLAASMVIVISIAVQVGFGPAVTSRVDRFFEARFASRPVITDASRSNRREGT